MRVAKVSLGCEGRNNGLLSGVRRPVDSLDELSSEVPTSEGTKSMVSGGTRKEGSKVGKKHVDGLMFKIRAVKSSQSRAQAQPGPLEGKFEKERSHGLLLSLHQMEVRTRSQGRSVSGQAAK